MKGAIKVGAQTLIYGYLFNRCMTKTVCSIRKITVWGCGTPKPLHPDTGDLVYMDEEGYFLIVDRLKRLVNRAGLKVWPAALEGEYYKHSAVQEVCIIGTPDTRVGEEVKACIVLKQDHVGRITQEELKAWGKQRFASYEYDIGPMGAPVFFHCLNGGFPIPARKNDHRAARINRRPHSKVQTGDMKKRQNRKVNG